MANVYNKFGGYWQSLSINGKQHDKIQVVTPMILL
jgi:hypothetical protein